MCSVLCTGSLPGRNDTAGALRRAGPRKYETPRKSWRTPHSRPECLQPDETYGVCKAARAARPTEQACPGPTQPHSPQDVSPSQTQPAGNISEWDHEVPRLPRGDFIGESNLRPVAVATEAGEPTPRGGGEGALLAGGLGASPRGDVYLGNESSRAGVPGGGVGARSGL